MLVLFCVGATYCLRTFADAGTVEKLHSLDDWIQPWIYGGCYIPVRQPEIRLDGFKVVGQTGGRCSAVSLYKNRYVLAGMGHALVVFGIENRGLVRQGSVIFPGSIKEIKVIGNHAFVIDEENGIRIVDLSNPCLPHLLSCLEFLDPAVSAAISQNHIYAATGAFGMQVIDIHDPAKPFFTAFITDSVYASPKPTFLLSIVEYITSLLGRGRSIGTGKIVVADKRLFTCGGAGSISVFDISTPSVPRHINDISSPNDEGVDFFPSRSGGPWFTADGDTLAVISRRLEPNQIRTEPNSGWPGICIYHLDGMRAPDLKFIAAPADQEVSAISVHSNKVFAATTKGLWIVDVSKPEPQTISFFPTGQSIPLDLSIDDDAKRLVLLDSDGKDYQRILSLDITNVAKLAVTGTAHNIEFIKSISQWKDHLAVIGSPDGMALLDLKDPTAPLTRSWVPGEPKEILVTDKYAYELCEPFPKGKNSVKIYDLSSDPPSLVATKPAPAAKAIALHFPYLYVVSKGYVDLPGRVEIWDVGQAYKPSYVGKMDFDGYDVQKIASEGDILALVSERPLFSRRDESNTEGKALSIPNDLFQGPTNLSVFDTTNARHPVQIFKRSERNLTVSMLLSGKRIYWELRGTVQRDHSLKIFSLSSTKTVEELAKDIPLKGVLSRVHDNIGFLTGYFKGDFSLYDLNDPQKPRTCGSGSITECLRDVCWLNRKTLCIPQGDSGLLILKRTDQ